MFGLPDCVRYVEVCYIEVRYIKDLFHTFYCHFGRDMECH